MNKHTIIMKTYNKIFLTNVTKVKENFNLSFIATNKDIGSQNERIVNKKNLRFEKLLDLTTNFFETSGVAVAAILKADLHQADKTVP
jgi:hypothetical protein